MSVRAARLPQELKFMERLREQTTFIDFEVEGNPPDKYLVIYKCTGMVSPNERNDEHIVEIYLHSEYPYVAPKVTILTPIFHPNIAAPLQVARIQAELKYLLDMAPNEAAREQTAMKLLNDEDLFKAHVCLDILDLNWSPAIKLDQVCIEIGEMIQYKRYNPEHPLNSEAATWAKENVENFPVDSRSLLDLKALEGIQILSTTIIDGDEEDSIRIIEDKNN